MSIKDKFIVAAKLFNLPPAVLAAIASRESRGGNILDAAGWGDYGNGFGVMQVDKNAHTVVTDGGPFGQAHINQAAGILRSALDRVMTQFPSLTAAQQLMMAVSRYNGGDLQPYPNSDEGTTGGDYANDVLARAKYYARVEIWV